ncbi:MAG: BatD family protein [Candidatus Methylacidiphilaceae bacterium]
MNRLAFIVFIVCAPCALLHAQSAHWVPLESGVTLDSPFRLELVVEGGMPQVDPDLPAIPYIEASSPKRESAGKPGNTSGASAVYVYTLRALHTGPYTIPAFPLLTDRGVASVPAFTFWVGEPSFSPSYVSSAEASLTLFRNEVWQGEPFPVEYRLLAHVGVFLDITGQPEWTPGDLLVDRWGRPERVSGESRGTFFDGFHYSALAVALNPGKVSLPPVTQHVRMETGKFGQGLFSQAIIRARILRSSPLSLQVKSLPAPPKEGFSQAVGTFRLTSQVSPSEVQVGEAATWTLRIEGTGNWTARWSLPSPTIPSGLRVIEPPPRRQNDSDSLFCASLVIERILVAERPGRYTIPPYVFVYFDPLAGNYRTVLAPSTVLTATPGSSSAGLPSDQGSPNGSTRIPAEATTRERLPKAPLSGSVRGLPPLENRWLFVEAGGTGAMLLVLWFFLARGHARRTDPLHRRRAGLRCLRRIHREIRRSGSAGDRQQQLLRWQSAMRDVWLVAPAAPEPAELEDALERAQVDRRALEDWMVLWQEAEVHLYAREASLPPNWIERAEEKARRIRIPRQSWRTTFALRHFFPTLAFSSLLLASCWGLSALELYRSGRFVQSGDLWERTLRKCPTDWIVRSNYGAALSQEGRWPEALAQWSSAFLLAPRDSAVRWNFALALSHCTGVDERLSALATGPLWFRWIGVGSPAEWQILVAVGLFALFLGALLFLLSRYRLVSSPILLRKTLFALGLSLSGIGATAVTLYGPMADPRAGLVTERSLLRSAPTDAAEQGSPAIASTLAVIGKPFLHWVQVGLSDSRSGWLRAQAVAPFFRPPLLPHRVSATPAAGSREPALPWASPR